MTVVLVRRGHRCSEKDHMITKVEAWATHLSGREHRGLPATSGKWERVVTFQHLLFRFLISKTVRAENECGFGLKVPRLWWLIKIAVWNEGADKVWAMQKTLGEDLDWGHHIPREPDVLLPSLHQVQMTEGVWCMSQPLLLQQRVYRVGGERKELKGALFLHWPYTGSGQSSPYSIESLPCHYAYQDIINLGKQWYLVAWTVPTKDPWKAQSAIGRWWNL